jgi:hypothetical protein
MLTKVWTKIKTIFAVLDWLAVWWIEFRGLDVNTIGVREKDIGSTD